MAVKPGYKQTEVGVVPEQWDVSTFSELFNITAGADFDPKRSQSFQDSIHPYPIYSNALTNSGLYGYCSYADHPANSITITARGMVGRANFRDHPYTAIGRVLVLNPKCEMAGFYFAHVINNSVKFANESTGVPQLTAPQISKYRLPVPPPGEQRAIATTLSDVDALLGAIELLIAKKRYLKQAAMQQLLSGQIRLPGFHGEWEFVQVQDVISGFFCGPSPTCEERNIQDESEWGVLKTTAATKENGWDWTKHKTLPRVFWNKPQIELRAGDVIVTKAGPRHRVGVAAWVNYVPPRIIPSGKMIALRPRPNKVESLMLATAISARDAQTYLDQRTTGMAESQVNFENTALLEAPIRIPRIEEQTAIAAVLTDMDAELTSLEQRLVKTRALKQGMMQELLTGRTRLL